jgi:hypothetical protein|tara:strand:+ start:463 stop:612 length:150 start_codon:yes stop_codon:yes gene_type:complete
MQKSKNPIAKDLRSPKYRKRVVESKKKYNRKRKRKEKEENEIQIQRDLD